MGHATDPMQIASASLSFVATLSRCRHLRGMTSRRRTYVRTYESCNPALAEFRVNETADNVDIIGARRHLLAARFWNAEEPRRRKVKVSFRSALCIRPCGSFLGLIAWKHSHRPITSVIVFRLFITIAEYNPLSWYHERGTVWMQDT